MKALCVESNLSMLKTLQNSVEKSPDIASVAAFDDESEALEWAKSNSFDIAFIGVHMHPADRAAFAGKLLRMYPGVHIIFCKEYNSDAFQLYASGYLLKPIGEESLESAIDHLKGAAKKNSLLTVRCFGSFDVFSQGVPISFNRLKTKELFAYLIDRRGAVVSSHEICAQLWEDERHNLNYLHQLITDLRRGLRKHGAEAVLQSHARGYSVDTSLVDCDFYKYLDGDESARCRFTGEYMSNYSWSEFTCAYLISKTQ